MNKQCLIKQTNGQDAAAASAKWRNDTLNAKMVEEAKGWMLQKTIEELVAIWTKHDRNEWSEEAFEAIKQIFTDRGIPIPIQNLPPVSATHGKADRELLRLPFVNCSNSFLSNRYQAGTLILTENALVFFPAAAFRTPGAGISPVEIFSAAYNDVSSQRETALHAALHAAEASDKLSVTEMLSSATKAIVIPLNTIRRISWPWMLSKTLRVRVQDGKMMYFEMNILHRDLVSELKAQLQRLLSLVS